jgi:hypothetical protein
MKCLVIGKRGLLDWVRNSSSSLSNRQHRSANLGMGLFFTLTTATMALLPLAKGSEGTLGRTRGDLLYICMEKLISVDALYTNNFWSTLHRHKPRP